MDRILRSNPDSSSIQPLTIASTSQEAPQPDQPLEPLEPPEPLERISPLQAQTLRLQHQIANLTMHLLQSPIQPSIHQQFGFILQGASMNVHVPASMSASTSAPFNSSPPVSQSSNEYVKTETLASMMAEFTKTMNEALSHSRSTQPVFSRRQDSDECNYCGGPHYI